MYQNIAVPVSFDEERDVASAIEIAKAVSKEGGRVTLIHVMETVPNFIADLVPDQVVAARREEIDTRLADLAASVPNGSAAVVHGAAGRAITGWADDNNADCIVIASHRPVISDMLLGSTAAWVVRHANCAVHVVR